LATRGRTETAPAIGNGVIGTRLETVPVATPARCVPLGGSGQFVQATEPAEASKLLNDHRSDLRR